MSKKQLKVLVVDDEKQHADVLAESLERVCEHVASVYDAQIAMNLLREEDFDIVVTDLNLKSSFNGLDILRAAKKANSETQVILVTAYATIETCKQAIREGAYDYLSKPVETEQLCEMVCRAGEKFIQERNAALKVSVRPKQTKELKYEGIQSNSPAMKHVFKVLERVSPTDISILVQGESGTGKEVMARAIHFNSTRSAGEYRPINCAGLSETLLESELFGHAKGSFTGAMVDKKGLFEVADGGTLFLDEIGDMPMSMQAKLLRVLEDGVITPVGSTRSIKVDVRIISATNHDLAKLVEEKKFRQDLYFRIKGVSVTLPPLRNRTEDIPDLVYYFLEMSCAELGCEMIDVTPKAMEILMHYSWPGNIRQLRHVVRTMIVMCESDIINVRYKPSEIHRIPQLTASTVKMDNIAGRPLSELEKYAISSTLKMVDGNREQAAKLLGIGERTLYRKIKEYDL